jgi:outer membrane immunogenic protein
MKKTVLAVSAATLFGFSASALAATPSFFVGAQAGYQNVDMEYTESESVAGFSQSGSLDYSLTGLAGGVFAGARFNLSPDFYLAPEVNLGTSNADGGLSYSDSDGDFYSYQFEAGRTYGVGVLAGYNLTDATSVYGRLGYQRTRFEVSESGTGLDGWSEDDNFSGARFGAGIETSLSSNLALRLDWSQTRYSSETYDLGQGESVTFDPAESLFQAGVVFSF